MQPRHPPPSRAGSAPAVGPRRRAAVAWGTTWLLCSAACFTPEESTYTLEIVGPANAFVGATSVGLWLGERKVAEAPLNNTGAFALEIGGVDPALDTSAVFTVKAVANDRLIAYGQTPPIEVMARPRTVRVFVQPPASVARSQDLTVTVRQHAAIAAEARPLGSLTEAMIAPLFGLGVADDKTPSRALFVYHPLTHQVQSAGQIALPRAEHPTLARSSRGEVFVFDGLPGASPSGATAQVERLAIDRVSFASLSVTGLAAFAGDPTTARGRAVLAAVGSRQLFIGGVDRAGIPLATVAALDETNTGGVTVSPYAPMLMARVGHSAVTDPTSLVDPATGNNDTAGRVLVYGGTTTDGPLAEVLVPKTATWTALPPVAGATGTRRKDHQALLLPGATETKIAKVLVIGGSDATNVARADTVLCTPTALLCEPGPITLRTPRKNFAAFILRDDLVVTGGLDDTGTPVPTTEIYDVASLAFVAVVPSVARAFATATTMPNDAAVILGGQAGDLPSALPSAAVEIYQPRRTPSSTR